MYNHIVKKPLFLSLFYGDVFQERFAYEGIRNHLNNNYVVSENSVWRFVSTESPRDPVIRRNEDMNTRFSPLLSMAFGGDDESEVVEFKNM